MIPVSRKVLQELFVLDTGSNVSVDDDVAEAFIDAQTNPNDLTVGRYAILAQVQAFVKKARDSEETPEQHVLAALEGLDVIEEGNRRVNRNREALQELPWLQSVVHLINRVLPPISSIEDEMWEYCRFGKGATYQGRGPEGRHLMTKIAGDGHSVTRRAFGLFMEVVSDHYPRWASLLMRKKVSFVPGNRIEFVPKDANRCRTIAVEPSCNMFLQLGVGTYISRRLRLFGVNLHDQSINRELARDGSIDGLLSTIDLSDASSRISRELVRALCPPDWFELLDTIRSPVGLHKGTSRSYEMFSSQGNGFTFPLESLIFWAICRSVSNNVSVYGDDLVVPT